MDKLRKALAGQEDQDDEERGFVSQVIMIKFLKKAKTIKYPYRHWTPPLSPGVRGWKVSVSVLVLECWCVFLDHWFWLLDLWEEISSSLLCFTRLEIWWQLEGEFKVLFGQWGTLRSVKTLPFENETLPSLQYIVPDGSYEAVEQHVRQDEGDSHGGDALCSHPHPLLCILVEEERASPHVRHHPVLRHDLVLDLLHPLRQGCCDQVFWWGDLVSLSWEWYKLAQCYFLNNPNNFLIVRPWLLTVIAYTSWKGNTCKIVCKNWDFKKRLVWVFILHIRLSK